MMFCFFSSRRRHTRYWRDWSSDVCSSDLYEGKVSNVENSLVLICYEVDGDKFKPPIYLLSTDIELNSETIIEYYLNRWTIETNYKYLKTHLSLDRKSTRLNSSHANISYAVFCLKKKNTTHTHSPFLLTPT